MNNRLGILKRIGELKKKGIEGRNARLFIESKLKKTYKRWEAAIRHHQARRARAVKLPVVKRPPDYSIYQCNLPYKWRAKFKNEQRRSKEVRLSKKQDAICRALACEERTVSYKQLCEAIFPTIVYNRQSGDRDRLHAAARQAVFGSIRNGKMRPKTRVLCCIYQGKPEESLEGASQSHCACGCRGEGANQATPTLYLTRP